MFKTHHCKLEESRVHTIGFLRLLVLESLESCWAGGRRGPSAAVPMLWSAGDLLSLPPPGRCAWPELTPTSSTAPVPPCANHRETLIVCKVHIYVYTVHLCWPKLLELFFGTLQVREDINWKKMFSFGRCPNDGGGSTHARIFWPSF